MDRARIYTAILHEHLQRHRQMAFVSGPRQVGKTWVCRSLANSYFNWDNSDDRRMLLRGPAALAEAIGLDRLSAKPQVAVLDELHKSPAGRHCSQASSTPTRIGRIRW